MGKSDLHHSDIRPTDNVGQNHLTWSAKCSHIAKLVNVPQQSYQRRLDAGLGLGNQ